jgi:hypothetical protein
MTQTVSESVNNQPLKIVLYLGFRSQSQCVREACKYCVSNDKEKKLAFHEYWFLKKLIIWVDT